MNKFTKRNHYNPCFWSALWCPTYYEKWLHGKTQSQVARNQVVYTLNFRSGHIHGAKVADVHYDKDLGVAEISSDSMRKFCRKWQPDMYGEIDAYLAANPEALYMDFEDVLTFVENCGVYDPLMQIAKEGRIASPWQKGVLACMLVVHAMRSHELMTSMTKHTLPPDAQKWEYFWLLRNAWANPLILARAVTPIALGKWTLFRTSQHHFPLPDSPVMIGQYSLMAVLSPRLLLEVELDATKHKGICVIRDRVPGSKYREFRRRAIRNTFKELVFSDDSILDEWRTTADCREQIRLLSDTETRTTVVKEAAARVLWACDGFGRLPSDFESAVQKYFDA